MKALVNLLSILLSMWEQYQEEKREAKRNADAKAVQDNPVTWFSGHFGGVPDDMPNNADDANKADSKPD